MSDRTRHMLASGVMLLATAIGVFLPGVLHHPLAYTPLLLALVISVVQQRPTAAVSISALASVALLLRSIDAAAGNEPMMPVSEVLVIVTLWILALLALRFRVGSTEWWLSGAQFQNAFDHAASGMALVSDEGRILYANDTLARMCGHTQRALTGMHLSELITEKDWPDLEDERQKLRSVDNEEHSIRGEHRMRRADDSEFWASISTGLVLDPSGRRSFFINQFSDLTPVQQAEQALRESEARFRGITENTAAITIVLDDSGRVSYVNPAFLRLLERPRESIIGQSPINLIHEDDQESFVDMVERTRRQRGMTYTLPQVRFQQLGGSWAILEAKITGLFEIKGIEGAVINCQEITGQVQAERALKRSETRFSTLFQASRDAILITRAADGAMLDFNDAFAELTAFAHEDSSGAESEKVLRLADEADTRRFHDKLEDSGEVVEFETVLITHDGRATEVMMSGRYAELDGELCIITVLRDISESRRTEAALRESEDKFGRIFNASPDSMVITRLSDGVILDVNDAFVEFFRSDRSQVVGRVGSSFEFSVPPEQLEAHRHMLESDDHAYLNVPVDFELGGQVYPTLVSTTLVEIHGENCAITQIKDMRELREVQQQMEASEARFRAAFDNAPIGMMLIRPDGTIGQVNRMITELFGYGPDELLEQPASMLVPEEERADHDAMIEALLTSDEDVVNAEVRLHRKRGEDIWTHRHIVVQRNADGSPYGMICQIADVTETKRSRQRMEKLAFYDTLTDLANRRLFADRLEQAVKHSMRSSTPTALLYLDLDNFKRVNDTLGHEAGDILLKEVANRLRACVRAEDTVGRLGGDEFVILLGEVRDARAPGKVARMILKKLQEPIQLGSHEVRVTTSIGITVAPHDGTDPVKLMKNADLAMYRSKEKGRDTYQFFAEEMNTRAMERLVIENDLRGALRSGEFELHYQPKVRLDNQEITGLEALIRWNHPKRGMVAPDFFIQIAEESGLILEMGDWILARACAEARSLVDAGAEHINVSVNISARQFSDPDLPGRIERALRNADLPPAHLELEITETMLMDDIDEAVKTLDSLQQLGVRLSIDDFGTGYSSLNYLKRLPIDVVKVDRSFVMDIPANRDDMAITAAVIAMAHRLNLQVVAEGVETAEQLFFLNEHQCEYGQGYLFGPPRPYAEIEAILVQGGTAEAAEAGA